jgi:hypothetical protein
MDVALFKIIYGLFHLQQSSINAIKAMKKSREPINTIALMPPHEFIG